MVSFHELKPILFLFSHGLSSPSGSLAIPGRKRFHGKAQMERAILALDTVDLRLLGHLAKVGYGVKKSARGCEGEQIFLRRWDNATLSEVRISRL